MPSIIQFLHTGAEHTFTKRDKYPLKEWNMKEHKRKYVKYHGQYVLDNRLYDSELEFWCEWEPQSIVTKRLNKISNNIIKNNTGYPKFLHGELYYENLDKRLPLQNTDPCIFGNQFKFGVCKQSKRYKDRIISTKMAQLDKGSIILFGSFKKNRINKVNCFILDTVFVVSDWIEYNNKQDIINSNDKRITESYKDIFAKKLNDDNVSRRLYFGATFEKPINGMYSYTPSKIHKNNEDYGFERPNIYIDNIINPKLNTSYKHTSMKIDECKKIWDDISNKIMDLGLVKGLNFKMPRKK